MTRETGKQRSQRIQIDYYRHAGGLQRLKYACVSAGLLGAGLYAAYVLAAGGGAHTSTGPLALSHASFENDCNQCHQDFTPIDSRGSKIDFDALGLSSSESIGRIEAACQRCHRVDNHHRNKMNDEWKLADRNCASCHADHNGRDHDLTLVSSTKCVSCHANLSGVCVGSATVRPNTTAFDKEHHGDFQSLLKEDSGLVKFDHQQHMQPGQVDAGRKGAFTIGMLDPLLRKRYANGGQNDSDRVQLDCDSCHQPAGHPDSANPLSADRELGRYMKPVSFDQHCSACHSMNPPTATADTLALPHAVPWNKIELLLEATLAGTRAMGQSRTPRDDSQTTPQPGEGPGNPTPPNPLVAVADVAAARQMVEAECLKCHAPQSITDQAIASGIEGTSQQMIPGRWLEHGLYDHAAHQRINCRYCHEGAYANDGVAKPPADHEMVMIAGIDSCTGCHRDPDSATPDSITDVTTLLGGQPTWASARCTLCHRYHTSSSMASSPATTVAQSETTP